MGNQRRVRGTLQPALLSSDLMRLQPLQFPSPLPTLLPSPSFLTLLPPSSPSLSRVLLFAVGSLEESFADNAPALGPLAVLASQLAAIDRAPEEELPLEALAALLEERQAEGTQGDEAQPADEAGNAKEEATADGDGSASAAGDDVAVPRADDCGGEAHVLENPKSFLSPSNTRRFHLRIGVDWFSWFSCTCLAGVLGMRAC